MTLSIFSSRAPSIAGIEFDAILEDRLEYSKELTGFAVEQGFRAVDHSILNPISYTMIGVVSNVTIGPTPTDFVGAVLPGAGGIGASIAGLSAGFLGGTDGTRSSAALDFLVNLVVTSETFEVFTGDRSLNNMIAIKLARVKNPENEDALFFELEMQELPTLGTVLSANGSDQDNLNPEDPAASQAATTVNRGEIAGSTPSAATLSNIKDFIL